MKQELLDSSRQVRAAARGLREAAAPGSTFASAFGPILRTAFNGAVQDPLPPSFAPLLARLSAKDPR